MTSLKWEKKGCILTPGDYWWMKTHAMLPTPLRLDNSTCRIYFGGRNDKNQSHIGYAEIDLNTPDKIKSISPEPVLRPGRLGCFDDNGVLPSCLIQHDQKMFLYYIGFKPGGTTRMDLFGGLAISDDGGSTFHRWSEAPIIERCRVNPFINTAPWVVRAQDGSWLMYYVAGIEWVHADLPRYNIQIASSDNLTDWHRRGQIAIDFMPDENALARPYVIWQDNHYKMWFSAKGKYYEVYEASSVDGLVWERTTKPSLKAGSGTEADAEMTCYPIVLKHHHQSIMYYNGNAYGRDGLLLAVSNV